jgi:hypothetical protein
MPMHIFPGAYGRSSPSLRHQRTDRVEHRPRHRHTLITRQKNRHGIIGTTGDPLLLLFLGRENCSTVSDLQPLSCVILIPFPPVHSVPLYISIIFIANYTSVERYPQNLFIQYVMEST